MTSQPFAETPAAHNPAAMRDWTRFAPDCSEVWVMYGDCPKIATVSDESYGGVGLVMETIDVVELEPGDRVTVFYYGHPMQGALRWIQKDFETHQIRIGVQWLSDSDGE